MRSLRSLVVTCVTVPALLITSCRKEVPPAPKTATPSAIHVRPHGDETIGPDSNVTPPEMKKVYDYIDQHISRVSRIA